MWKIILWIVVTIVVLFFMTVGFVYFYFELEHYYYQNWHQYKNYPFRLEYFWENKYNPRSIIRRYNKPRKAIIFNMKGDSLGVFPFHVDYELYKYNFSDTTIVIHENDSYLVEGHLVEGVIDSIDKFICTCYNAKDVENSSNKSLSIHFYKKSYKTNNQYLSNHSGHTWGISPEDYDTLHLAYYFERHDNEDTVSLWRYIDRYIEPGETRVNCKEVLKHFGLYYGKVQYDIYTEDEQ